MSAVETEPFAAEQQAQAGLELGLDTVDVAQLHGLQFSWLAGYGGGLWPTFAPECILYPALHARGRIMSYAVTVSEDADLGDCERGDMTVGQTADIWLPRQIKRGVWRPGAYANLDTWTNGGLHDATAHFGASIRRIVADYTYRPSCLPGYDAQQFSDRWMSRNVDANMARPTFFPPAAAAAHVNHVHYDWFASGGFATQRWGKLVERHVVEEYDGARQHPDKYRHYLPRLEAMLMWLRNRVCWEAMIAQPHLHGPSWDQDRRGWRRFQMERRAHGQKFV